MLASSPAAPPWLVPVTGDACTLARDTVLSEWEAEASHQHLHLNTSVISCKIQPYNA